jgi:hypothetical protein
MQMATNVSSTIYNKKMKKVLSVTLQHRSRIEKIAQKSIFQSSNLAELCKYFKQLKNNILHHSVYLQSVR